MVCLRTRFLLSPSKLHLSGSGWRFGIGPPIRAASFKTSRRGGTAALHDDRRSIGHLAGFGPVIAWLRDGPSGSDSFNLWRVKTIVRHALTIAFLCLSLVPIHTFTQGDMTTIRIGSALFLIFEVVDLLGIRRPD